MPALLVIDDDPLSLELVRVLMKAHGYTVFEAGNIQDALKILNKHPVDMIITDIQMPDMGGSVIIRHIKENPKTRLIPLIAMTAYAMPGDREKFLAAGYSGYIPKPINVEDFPGEITNYLYRSKHNGQ